MGNNYSKEHKAKLVVKLLWNPSYGYHYKQKRYIKGLKKYGLGHSQLQVEHYYQPPHNEEN